MKQSITCIIITKNEEKNISNAVCSALQVCERVVVVDSGSEDKTVPIAKENGAEVFVHEFVTHGKQFNWALDNCGVATKWILRLDADEVITPELASEIENAILAHAEDDINGFAFKFKVFFMGKFLKHGGMYPFVKLCLFKKGTGRVIETAMRDQTVLISGKSQMLKNDCLHYDYKNLESWISKHNRYSSLETANVLGEGGSSDDGLLPQIKRNKTMREKVYYKLPLFFRCWLYYLYILIIRLAFLDGRPGIIHAYLHAYWYRYLIDAKIYEAKKAKKKP